MVISRRLLDPDESVVVSTRAHAKALVAPMLVLILLASVAGVLGSFTGAAGRAQPLLLAVIWGVAAVGVVRWVVLPVVGWLATSYTLTDRRLIARRSVLRRRGYDIPLPRVSDVSYERGVLDRLLGSGTLLVSVSGGRRTELPDMPHVERFHHDLQRLLHDRVATQRIRHRSGSDGR